MVDDACPNFFVLLNHVKLDTRLFAGLPASLFLVEFQASGIEMPSSEPLGVYYYAGIRPFIWKDRFYSAYNLDYRATIRRVSELIIETRTKEAMTQCHKMLNLLKHYGTAPPPNFDSTHDKTLSDPERNLQKFVRAIYEID